MKVTQDFERWAKGFSGCDGGNLHGSVWFCGIEWGTGKEHDLKTELGHPVSDPPQLYQTPEDVLRNVTTGKLYPYNIKLIKLIAAIGSGTVSDYKWVANEIPFPFHRDSEFFKLNLFPVAYRSVNDREWNNKYEAATGLPTINHYLEWCRENRFPRIRAWMQEGQPKLVIGVGRSHKEDFQRAFGFNGAENEEIIEGGKLVWTFNGKAILAVIPFLGHQKGSLNSDQLLQAFGERLGEILNATNEFFDSHH